MSVILYCYAVLCCHQAVNMQFLGFCQAVVWHFSSTHEVAIKHLTCNRTEILTTTVFSIAYIGNALVEITI